MSIVPTSLRARGHRRPALVVLLAVLVLGLPVAAWAVVTDNPASTSYTGCLKTTGAIAKVKKGNAPLSACADGEQIVRLSGGDITAVEPGIGMYGGATSGPASLGLLPSYQLPQNCGVGQVPARGAYSNWTCSSTGSRVIDFQAGFGGAQMSKDWAVVKNMFLTPGTYSANAYVDVYQYAANPSVYAYCRLDTPTKTYIDSREISQTGMHTTVPLQGTFQMLATGNASILCQDGGIGDMRLRKIRILVTPIGTATTGY